MSPIQLAVQAKDYKQEKGDWLSSVWSGFNSPSQTSRIRNTGVPADFLRQVGMTVSTLVPWLTGRCIMNKRLARRKKIGLGNKRLAFL